MLLTDNELLIEKAEINYDKFLVPTSQVQSKKTKRYNTAWHKYDLDEKTSVNKIGEIINLSQILNSRLWELKKQGEDYKDIYDDICKLAVLSCVAIDMAKKEFSIDVTEELKLLRKKYSELVEQKPMFFYHLPKDEHMKSAKEKYRNYDTAMDYLELILDEVGKRTRVKRSEPIDFSMLFNNKPLYENKRNKQIDKILSIRDEYTNKINYIWMNELKPKSERYKEYINVKEEYINEIAKIKLNSATIRGLLFEIEKTNQIKMMSILFGTHKESFMKLIESQYEDINIIKKDDYGKIIIYGKSFNKTKVKTILDEKVLKDI